MKITIEIRRPGWLTSGRLKRARPLVVVLLLALVFAAPVLAFDRFTDVGPGVHHNDISAIAAAGITQGCNPPDNTLYCPDAFVRRDQMGSFLARAAGLGTNPPVANADKLDDLDSYHFLRSATYKKTKDSTGGAGGNEQGSDAVGCNFGDRLLSGGISNLDPGTSLIQSSPSLTTNAWDARWENNSTVDTVTLVVLCATHPLS